MTSLATIVGAAIAAGALYWTINAEHKALNPNEAIAFACGYVLGQKDMLDKTRLLLPNETIPEAPAPCLAIKDLAAQSGFKVE